VKEEGGGAAPRISVIIVNFNGEKLLEDCLVSLAAQEYRDFEVVFVDNGSKDNSVARARELLPSAHVIALPQNTGFATGNNIGIRAARGRHVVLLNNDTKTDPRFLGEMARAADSGSRVGMVAPKILNFFNPRVIDSVGGLLLGPDGIGQGRGRGEEDCGQYDQLVSGLLPSGCAALYKREMLDEIGLLPDEFFAYCEDSDLGLRAVWAGWTTAAAPRAVVYHKYSATTSGYSPFKMRLVERNHYFLALRNYPKRRLALLPLFTVFRWLLMAYAVLFRKGKGAAAGSGGLWPLLKAFFQGHIEALAGVFRQLRQRPRIRRIDSKAFAALLDAYNMPLWRIVLKD
jgi:GT2 family glycosyltransferase